MCAYNLFVCSCWNEKWSFSAQSAIPMAVTHRPRYLASCFKLCSMVWALVSLFALHSCFFLFFYLGKKKTFFSNNFLLFFLKFIYFHKFLWTNSKCNMFYEWLHWMVHLPLFCSFFCVSFVLVLPKCVGWLHFYYKKHTEVYKNSFNFTRVSCGCRDWIIFALTSWMKPVQYLSRYIMLDAHA